LFLSQNGKQRLTAHTLKYYETELDGRGFLRVHRGFIVNQNCILRHDTESSQLFLMEGHEVEISRRRRGEGIINAKSLVEIAQQGFLVVS
jgi:DNA-binding LytR/AlgR family response regulator